MNRSRSRSAPAEFVSVKARLDGRYVAIDFTEPYLALERVDKLSFLAELQSVLSTEKKEVEKDLESVLGYG